MNNIFKSAYNREKQNNEKDRGGINRFNYEKNRNDGPYRNWTNNSLQQQYNKSYNIDQTSTYNDLIDMAFKKKNQYKKNKRSNNTSNTHKTQQTIIEPVLKNDDFPTLGKPKKGQVNNSALLYSSSINKIKQPPKNNTDETNNKNIKQDNKNNKSTLIKNIGGKQNTNDRQNNNGNIKLFKHSLYRNKYTLNSNGYGSENSMNDTYDELSQSSFDDNYNDDNEDEEEYCDEDDTYYDY